MAKDNVETELKLYMPFLNEVARKIEAAGGKLSAPRILERNVRYDNAANEFAANNTTLRLRMDTRARLTYKDGERKITLAKDAVIWIARPASADDIKPGSLITIAGRKPPEGEIKVIKASIGPAGGENPPL